MQASANHFWSSEQIEIGTQSVIGVSTDCKTIVERTLALFTGVARDVSRCLAMATTITITLGPVPAGGDATASAPTVTIQIANAPSSTTVVPSANVATSIQEEAPTGAQLSRPEQSKRKTVTAEDVTRALEMHKKMMEDTFDVRTSHLASENDASFHALPPTETPGAQPVVTTAAAAAAAAPVSDDSFHPLDEPGVDPAELARRRIAQSFSLKQFRARIQGKWSDAHIMTESESESKSDEDRDALMQRRFEDFLAALPSDLDPDARSHIAAFCASGVFEGTEQSDLLTVGDHLWKAMAQNETFAKLIQREEGDSALDVAEVVAHLRKSIAQKCRSLFFFSGEMPPSRRRILPSPDLKKLLSQFVELLETPEVARGEQWKSFVRQWMTVTSNPPDAEDLREECIALGEAFFSLLFQVHKTTRMSFGKPQFVYWLSSSAQFDLGNPFFLIALEESLNKDCFGKTRSLRLESLIPTHVVDGERSPPRRHGLPVGALV